MVDWKIGPTFSAECAVAGIDMNGWGWNYITGECTFSDDVPQATRDAVATVYAAHDPAAQTDPPTVPYPPGVPTQKPAQHAPRA